MHGYGEDLAQFALIVAAVVIAVLALLGGLVGWACGRPGLGAACGAGGGVALILLFVAWVSGLLPWRP